MLKDSQVDFSVAGNRVTLNRLRFLGTFSFHVKSLSLKLTSSKSSGDSGLIDVEAWSWVSELDTSFAGCLKVPSSELVADTLYSSNGDSFLERRRFMAGVLQVWRSILVYKKSCSLIL